MPELKNLKWERFAQLVSRGATYADAIRAVPEYSHQKNPRNYASELVAKPEVKARIAELKAVASDFLKPETELLPKPDLEWFYDRWRRNIVRSELANDRAGVNNNLLNLAKLCGYMVERSEVTQNVSPIESLTPYQLQSLVQWIEAKRNQQVTIIEATTESSSETKTDSKPEAIEAPKPETMDPPGGG